MLRAVLTAVRRQPAVLLLALGLLIGGLIAFIPTSDQEFGSCKRPPVRLVVDPYDELPDTPGDFGFHCNHDARFRSGVAGIVALGGLVSFVILRRKSPAE